MDTEDETEFVLVIRNLTRDQLKQIMPLTKELGDKRVVLDQGLVDLCGLGIGGHGWDDIDSWLVEAGEK